MAKPLINYFNRDFDSLQTDLLNYAKTYHSDLFKYLNSATPDYFFIQLLSYIGDSLGYQVDKAFNESFRFSAQSRESLVRIAKDLMFNDFYAKPSSTQIILTINVPYKLDATSSKLLPDENYLFTINSGLVLRATNGSYFETLEEISFKSNYNRIIIPNYNANGLLVNFTVSKTSVVYAGETKIQRFYVSPENSKPFLEILIDDVEITEVLSVVAVAGNSYSIPTDEEFRSVTSNNVYIEVKELFQDKLFVETPPNFVDNSTLTNAYNESSIQYGEWVNKTKRFIVRRDKENNTSIIFGSTLTNFSDWENLINQSSTSELNNVNLNEVLNNMSLGEIPASDTTLFIKYRTGAGVKTNVPANSITEIIQKDITIDSNPPSTNIYNQVVNSLTINNKLAAVGGTNILTNEEIRNIAPKTFAANDRGVNYEDIKALIQTMPPKFGTPFRVSYEEIKPKLLNYTQLKNYITAQADLIQNSTNSIDRNQKITDLLNYIKTYPDATAYKDANGNIVQLSTVSNALNGAENIKDHKLWYGEKCRLYVLGLDSNLIPTTLYKNSIGVWQDPNLALKNNIKNFLTTKRVIGDWIDIVDADVVNFQVEFSIMADKKNKQKVLVDCLNKLREYFNVYNWQINQAIFLANVSTAIQEIEGVLTLVDLKFYNIFGTDVNSGKTYSAQETGQYKNNLPTSTNSQNNRFEMGSINNIIPSYPSTFFHLRYPDSDLIGKVL